MLFVLYHIYAYFSRPFITGLTGLFVLEILIRVASVIDHSSAVEAGKGPSYIMNDEYIRENGYGGKKRSADKSIIKIGAVYIKIQAVPSELLSSIEFK